MYIASRKHGLGRRTVNSYLGAFLFFALSTGSLSFCSPKQPTVESAPVLSEERVAEIQGILQERVDKYKKTIGIVVGIINEKGSKVISYGKLSQDGSREVDGSTVFEIGSITKVFTALLLADMAERGELNLDDPIAKFLPESVKIPSKDDKQITLFHLGTHTSGLPRMPDNFHPADLENPYADYTVEKMYEFLSGYTLTRGIGTRIEYSNYGGGLLGHILALKAGRDYETLVTERICEPLGMNSTRIKLTPELLNRLATGHNVWGEVVKNWDFQALAGCGALSSTANDLLKFLAANLGLSESSLWPAMQKTLIVQDSINLTYKNHKIGLAWFIGNKDGTEYILHNGGTGGYRSFIGFVQDKRRGVVVLSNSNHRVDDIGRHLLDSKFELAELEPPHMEIEVNTEIFNEYVGKYEITPEIVFDVTTENGKLMVQITGQPSLQVFPESDTTFFYKVVDAQITFCKNEKGQVTHLIKHQGGHDVTAVRQGADFKPPWSKAEITVEPELLESYVGKYEMKPGAVFTVTLEDGKLMVRLTGQPSIEVFPESETEFFYKVVDAQITFVKDEQGQVTHLILHQGGSDLTARRLGDDSRPPTPKKEIQVDPAILASYVGKYEMGPGAVFTVTLDDGKLMVRLTGQPYIEVFPESETEFFYKVVDAQITFEKDAGGNVTGLILHQGGEDHKAKKIE